MIEDSTLTNGAFVITCFSNEEEVRLIVRYEVVDDGVIVEHLTDQDGEFVDEIIFHRLDAG